MAATRRSTRSRAANTSATPVALKTRNATRVVKPTKPPKPLKTAKALTRSTRRNVIDAPPPEADDEHTPPPEADDEQEVADDNNAGSNNFVEKSAVSRGRATRGRGKATAVGGTYNAATTIPPLDDITGNADAPGGAKGKGGRRARGKNAAVAHLPSDTVDVSQDMEVPDRTCRSARGKNAASVLLESGPEAAAAPKEGELDQPVKEARTTRAKEAAKAEREERVGETRATRGKKTAKPELEGPVEEVRATQGKKATKPELEDPVEEVRATRGKKAAKPELEEPVGGVRATRGKRAAKPELEAPREEVRATRGKKIAKPECGESTEEVRATRGKKAAKPEREQRVEEVRATRGKNVAKPELEEPVEEVRATHEKDAAKPGVEEPAEEIRTTRGKKAVKPELEEPCEEVRATRGKRTAKPELQELVKEVRATRGRKAEPVVLPEGEQQSEPAKSRATRGRKNASPQQKKPVKTRATRAAQLSAQNDQEEEVEGPILPQQMESPLDTHPPPPTAEASAVVSSPRPAESPLAPPSVKASAVPSSPGSVESTVLQPAKPPLVARFSPPGAEAGAVASPARPAESSAALQQVKSPLATRSPPSHAEADTVLSLPGPAGVSTAPSKSPPATLSAETSAIASSPGPAESGAALQPPATPSARAGAAVSSPRPIESSTAPQRVVSPLATPGAKTSAVVSSPRLVEISTALQHAESPLAIPNAGANAVSPRPAGSSPALHPAKSPLTNPGAKASPVVSPRPAESSPAPQPATSPLATPGPEASVLSSPVLAALQHAKSPHAAPSAEASAVAPLPGPAESCTALQQAKSSLIAHSPPPSAETNAVLCSPRPAEISTVLQHAKPLAASSTEASSVVSSPGPAESSTTLQQAKSPLIAHSPLPSTETSAVPCSAEISAALQHAKSPLGTPSAVVSSPGPAQSSTMLQLTESPLATPSVIASAVLSSPGPVEGSTSLQPSKSLFATPSAKSSAGLAESSTALQHAKTPLATPSVVPSPPRPVEGSTTLQPAKSPLATPSVPPSPGPVEGSTTLQPAKPPLAAPSVRASAALFSPRPAEISTLLQPTEPPLAVSGPSLNTEVGAAVSSPEPGESSMPITSATKSSPLGNHPGVNVNTPRRSTRHSLANTSSHIFTSPANLRPVDAEMHQDGFLDSNEAVAELAEREAVLTPPLQPSPRISEPDSGNIIDDDDKYEAEAYPLDAKQMVVEETEPEQPFDHNDAYPNPSIPRDFTVASMTKGNFSIDPGAEEFSGDLGILRTPQNPLGSLETPVRQTFLARDPVMGTPLGGSTPQGSPSLGLGNPLIDGSFTGSFGLSSPSTPGQRRIPMKSPSKSPSPMPNTPIKVFSPSAGSSAVVRSVLSSPSGPSLMGDARRFTQLSPSASEVISGDARSPVKQSPHQSPFTDVQSPLGLYGMTMPSSPLKRPLDPVSVDYDLPTKRTRRSLLLDSIGTDSPTTRQSPERELSSPLRRSFGQASTIREARRSPSDQQAGHESLLDSSFGLSPVCITPLKNTSDTPTMKQPPEQEASSPPQRLFDQAVAFGGAKRSSLDRPAGHGSLFDPAGSLGPLRITPQGDETDNGSPAIHLPPAPLQRPPSQPLLDGPSVSLKPVKPNTPNERISSNVNEPPVSKPPTLSNSSSPAKRSPRERPVGFDSLFDDSCSLSPVQLPLVRQLLSNKSAILKSPAMSTLKSSPRKRSPRKGPASNRTPVRSSPRKAVAPVETHIPTPPLPAEVPSQLLPLRTDDEPSGQEAVIPSSPPTAGLDSYGGVLPDDIGDATKDNIESSKEVLSKPLAATSAPVFSADFAPTAESPEQRDDTFSPVRLSPFKHPIERPPNPTPTKARGRNYQLQIPSSSPLATTGRGSANACESFSSPFLENIPPVAPDRQLGEIESETSISPLGDTALMTTGQGLREVGDGISASSLEVSPGQELGEVEDGPSSPPPEDVLPEAPGQGLGMAEVEPLSFPPDDVPSAASGQELGEVKDEPSSTALEVVPPTATSRQSIDYSYDEPSSPFLENVPPATPGSILKTISSSQLPKRRLRRNEALQSRETGPSTPARRLRENIQIAPDSVSRKRYGRRASSDLISMANEPLMETLKALARGYLVRKRIGPIKSEDPSTSDDGQRKEEELKQFGILDTFIRKHEEKAKSAPPSRIPTPVRNTPKSGSTVVTLAPLSPPPHSSPSSESSSSTPNNPKQSLKRKAEDTPSPQQRMTVVGLRKSPRSGIKPPAISLAPVSKRRAGPVTWDTMLDRDRQGLVRKNTQLNCAPSLHTREVERKPIPRPPSPNAALQTKLAMDGRRKRKAHFLKTGIELGPGENIDFKPKRLTPPRKGVRWGAPLESGYTSEPETRSPSQARGLQTESKLVNKEVVLDKFGNLEGAPPLGGGSPVVIKKVLYKGEIE